MSATSAKYLSTLHDNMDRYFSLEEIRTLCFDLGVDFDSVRGEGKAPRIRELILALARNGRLPELLSLLHDERPFVNWAPIPDDFQLPQSLQSETAAGTVINNYYGDTFNLSGNFQGANVNVKSTLQNVAQTINALPAAGEAQKTELQQLLVHLNNLLQQAPADQATVAEEISQSTSILVEEGSKDQPNKMIVKLLGSGLQSTAKSLALALPPVATIIDQIVTAVTQLSTKSG